eukprot:6321049-Heterocapsa_arctica.AAC.1
MLEMMTYIDKRRRTDEELEGEKSDEACDGVGRVREVDGNARDATFEPPQFGAVHRLFTKQMMQF